MSIDKIDWVQWSNMSPSYFPHFLHIFLRSGSIYKYVTVPYSSKFLLIRQVKLCQFSIQHFSTCIYPTMSLVMGNIGETIGDQRSQTDALPSGKKWKLPNSPSCTLLYRQHFERVHLRGKPLITYWEVAKNREIKLLRGTLQGKQALARQWQDNAQLCNILY